MFCFPVFAISIYDIVIPKEEIRGEGNKGLRANIYHSRAGILTIEHLPALDQPVHPSAHPPPGGPPQFSKISGCWHHARRSRMLVAAAPLKFFQRDKIHQRRGSLGSRNLLSWGPWRSWRSSSRLALCTVDLPVLSRIRAITHGSFMFWLDATILVPAILVSFLPTYELSVSKRPWLADPNHLFLILWALTGCSVHRSHKVSLVSVYPPLSSVQISAFFLNPSVRSQRDHNRKKAFGPGLPTS